jgi:hypothetical protein
MDKEIRMKASPLLIAVGLILTMVGCGSGKDPGAAYDVQKKQASAAADPLAPPVDMKPPPAPVQPDNSQSVCGQVFTMSVTDDKASKLLAFKENTEASYQIKVISLFGPSFNVAPENLAPTLAADFHSGRAKFNQVSKDGVTATYAFSWKPSALSTSNGEFQTLTLKYTSAAAAKCGQDISESLSLVLDPQGQGASK